MLPRAALLRNSVASSIETSTRSLSLHEYQSTEILARHGCSVPKFVVADSAARAQEEMEKLKSRRFQVKPQILEGMGHLQSAFQTCNSKIQAIDAVDKMLGRRIVTEETAANGPIVKKVMISESFPVVRKSSLAIMLSREDNGVVIVGRADGLDSFKEVISLSEGVTVEKAMEVAARMQFRGEGQAKAASEIVRLYSTFRSVDATAIEVASLVETGDGRVLCLDVSVTVDPYAFYRQKDIFDMENVDELDPRDVEAHSVGLNYVGLDGNIGCVVNGAGLGLATMDAVTLAGGRPANFLDMGGAITEEGMGHAVRIITADPKVRSLLVNAFCGMLDCGSIARALIGVARKRPINVPLVVRLQGTNVAEGRRLLRESGLPIIHAEEIDEAAEKAVAALRE